MTIGTGIRVISLVALATLAASPAVSAVQSAKERLAEAVPLAKQAAAIEIIAPVGEHDLGTIRFWNDGEGFGTGLRFGGPR